MPMQCFLCARICSKGFTRSSPFNLHSPPVRRPVLPDLATHTASPSPPRGSPCSLQGGEPLGGCCGRAPGSGPSVHVSAHLLLRPPHPRARVPLRVGHRGPGEHLTVSAQGPIGRRLRPLPRPDATPQSGAGTVFYSTALSRASFSLIFALLGHSQQPWGWNGP